MKRLNVQGARILVRYCQTCIEVGDVRGSRMYSKAAIHALFAMSLLPLTGCAGVHLGKILKEIDSIKDPCMSIDLTYTLTSTYNKAGGLSADVTQIADLAEAAGQGVGTVNEEIKMKVVRKAQDTCKELDKVSVTLGAPGQ